MEKNYKFILKKLVCNKVRNIYIKINSKSKKQYLKYKGKMINIKKYKKIKQKKGGAWFNTKQYTWGQRAQNIGNKAMGIANNASDFYKERQRQEMKKKRDLIKNALPDRQTQLVERARLARVTELQQKKEKDKTRKRAQTAVYGNWHNIRKTGNMLGMRR